MNLKVEHGIIAVLVLALLYYVYSHHSLLNDLSGVPHDNNPQLKVVKEKHSSSCTPGGDCGFFGAQNCRCDGSCGWGGNTNC